MTPQEAMDEQIALKKKFALLIVIGSVLTFMPIIISFAKMQTSEESFSNQFIFAAIVLVVSLIAISIVVNNYAKKKFPIQCTSCKTELSLKDSEIKSQGKSQTTTFKYQCDQCGKEFTCQKNEYV